MVSDSLAGERTLPLDDVLREATRQLIGAIRETPLVPASDVEHYAPIMAPAFEWYAQRAARGGSPPWCQVCGRETPVYCGDCYDALARGGRPPDDSEHVHIVADMPPTHGALSSGWFWWRRCTSSACIVPGGSPAGEPCPACGVQLGDEGLPSCNWRNGVAYFYCPECYTEQHRDSRSVLRAAASGSARPPEPTSDAFGMRGMTREESAEFQRLKPPAKPLLCAECSNPVRGSARPGAADPLREALDDLSGDGCLSLAIERYKSRAPGMPHPSADGIKGILEPLWAALSERAALSGGAADPTE